MKCTKADLDNTVPIHPSLAEVIKLILFIFLGNGFNEMKLIIKCIYY